jgi:hypothetical protein
VSSLARTESIAKIVAAVVIPVAVVIVGQEYSRAVKQREIEAKYVELAIGILRSPPADEAFDIRAWAVEVVNSHSGVKLTELQREDLIRTGTLGAVTIPGGPSSASIDPVPDRTVPPPDRREIDDEVTVPNVRGLTISAARDAFARAGLELASGMSELPDDVFVNTQQPAVCRATRR